MIKAVIFDFDGVLVNTMPLHFRSWEKLSQSLGYELDESIIDRLRGASRDKSLEAVLAHNNITASDEEKMKFQKIKDKWFQKELANIDSNIVLDGVKDLLGDLKEAALKLAVASASRNAANILKELQLDRYFDVILDANDIQITKPDPAVFIATLKLLGTEPQESLIIEDSPLGIAAAKEINCPCFAIGTDPLLNEADRVFNSTSEIKALDIQSF